MINKVKKLIKGFLIIIALMLLIIIIGISLYITTRWLEFQKVYSSYEDKKLALRIEKTLEKSAKNVKENKKSISINLYELTKNREFDKICIVGPYNPDINQFLGVDWKQSNIWNQQVINYDTLNSIFLIKDNTLVPIKIRINKIKYISTDNKSADTKIRINKNGYIFINNPCAQVNKDTTFKLIENNSNVDAKITN